MWGSDFRFQLLPFSRQDDFRFRANGLYHRALRDIAEDRFGEHLGKPVVEP
jgi:hypothetical protein